MQMVSMPYGLMPHLHPIKDKGQREPDTTLQLSPQAIPRVRHQARVLFDVTFETCTSKPFSLM